MIERDEEGEKAMAASRLGMRQVVDENELALLTSQGWHLVFSYEVDAPVKYRVPDPDRQASNQRGGYYSNEYATLESQQIGKVRRFVVGLSEDNSLQLLSKLLDDAAKNADASRDALYKTQTELGDEKKSHEKTKAALDESRLNCKKARDEAQLLTESNRAMEKDLGMYRRKLAEVKKEIGAERYRAIVGEDFK